SCLALPRAARKQSQPCHRPLVYPNGLMTDLNLPWHAGYCYYYSPLARALSRFCFGASWLVIYEFKSSARRVTFGECVCVRLIISTVPCFKCAVLSVLHSHFYGYLLI